MIRQKIAQLYIESEVLRLTASRGLTSQMKTGIPGPEGSLVKWQWSDTNQAMTELAMEIRGPEAPIVDSDWTYRFLRARANSIEGGTTEILKNIVAERVLGMPRLCDELRLHRRPAGDQVHRARLPRGAAQARQAAGAGRGRRVRRRALEGDVRARLAGIFIGEEHGGRDSAWSSW